MSRRMGSADTSIVAYGVSDQLKAEFDMLREVSCTQGKIKFPAKTVDTLAQHVVCRHYSNLCYEFSHLNWALIYANTNSTRGIQTALVDYYWIDQCHWPQHFNRYFSVLCQPIKDTQDEAITLSINHELSSGSREKTAGISLRVYDHYFSISASRANILACFMEWIICIVPDLLNVLETSLHGKGHNAISEFSSFLQKQIYDYLSKHLPPAKLQQRFRLIQNWYSSPPQKQMSDDNLLDFWQQHSTLEGYGKYSNVLKDSLSYLTALAMVKTSVNVQYANTDDNSYESSIDQYSNEQMHNEANLHFESVSQYSAKSELTISRLLDSPKVLNKQQVELFELFSKYPQHLLPLSGSWLRLQVFGKVQHQIIQMIRVKDVLATDTQHYLQLCQSDYQHITHNCIQLMASNQQSLLAITQLMFSFGPDQACLILLKLMPQLPSFATHTQDFASLLEDAVGAGETINKKLVLQWQLSYPWINKLLKQSELALKQINRQGFTSTSLLQCEDYLQCAELLFDLNKLIKQVVKQINKKEQDSEENFEADRLIFVCEFSTLYAHNDRCSGKKTI